LLDYLNYFSKTILNQCLKKANKVTLEANMIDPLTKAEQSDNLYEKFKINFK